MVKTVGSRELKNRLGTYLSQVREGTRIIVTDRGRPVAELRAFQRDATDEESGLLELAARGWSLPGLAKSWRIDRSGFAFPESRFRRRF